MASAIASTMHGSPVSGPKSPPVSAVDPGSLATARPGVCMPDTGVPHTGPSNRFQAQ